MKLTTFFSAGTSRTGGLGRFLADVLFGDDEDEVCLGKGPNGRHSDAEVVGTVESKIK